MIARAERAHIADLADPMNPATWARASVRWMQALPLPASDGCRPSGHSHIRALAMQVESDPERVARWWTDDRIEELGGLTAAELLASGRGEALEAFPPDLIAGPRA